jgi:hypothetical protein
LLAIPMAVEKKTREDLLVALRKQRGFLARSGEAFDAGNHDEALRLAVTIRVLVHDTESSHSLLSQLGLKDQFQWVDTANPAEPTTTEAEDGSLLMEQSLPTGLLGFTFNSEGALWIAPKRARGHVPRSFDDWWSASIIPSDNGLLLTRKQLVLWQANQDGGAHVDPDTDVRYRDLRVTQAGTTVTVNGVESTYVNSAADVSLRQIAWEVEETLHQAGRLL